MDRIKFFLYGMAVSFLISYFSTKVTTQFEVVWIVFIAGVLIATAIILVIEHSQDPSNEIKSRRIK